MASLLPVVKTRFFDANGDPLSGGKVFSYVAGTNTPLATYTDQTGLVANTNPVILDSQGYANIWLTGSYKIILQDSAGSQIFSVDNIFDLATQIGTTFGNIINVYGGITGGTSTQYTATPAPALTSYVTGQVVRVFINTANTAPATLNVSGLGDVAIRKSEGGALVPLVAGDLAASSVREFSYDGTFWQLINANYATLAQGALAATALQNGGKFSAAVIQVRDEKAAGTEGGTFTAGAEQTRNLTTVVTNTITGASLATNQITLPVGTFDVIARAPAYGVGRHRALLFNVTGAATLLQGSLSSSSAGTPIMTDSWVRGRFTLAAISALEIRHRCETTNAVTGFGTGLAALGTGVFTDVTITQVA